MTGWRQAPHTYDALNRGVSKTEVTTVCFEPPVQCHKLIMNKCKILTTTDVRLPCADVFRIHSVIMRYANSQDCHTATWAQSSRAVAHLSSWLAHLLLAVSEAHAPILEDNNWTVVSVKWNDEGVSETFRQKNYAHINQTLGKTLGADMCPYQTQSNI